MEQQSLDVSTSVDNMITEYFKSIVETYCSGEKKKILLKNCSLLTMHWVTQRALMEMYKTHVVLMPANTTSIL